MKKSKAQPLKLALVVMTCTAATNAAAVNVDRGHPQGGPASLAPTTLKPRGSHASLKRTVRAQDFQAAFRNRIEVKFREGSGVRSRGGELALEPTQARGAAALAELDKVRATLRGARRYAAMKMHPFTEDTAAALKAQGERSGTELPDPNLWYYLYVDAGSDQEVADVVNALNALDVVELAYPSPLPVRSADMDSRGGEEFEAYWREHARMDWPTPEHLRSWERGESSRTLLNEAPPPPTAVAAPTPALGPSGMLAVSYVADQDYGEAAPIGINTDWLRSNFYNAYGNGWGYTDAEYAWNYWHQDLTQLTGAVLVNGQPHASAAVLGNRNHGTSVIGVLSSDTNAFGTTGLVNGAQVRLSTEWPTTGYNRASAIYAASNQFWAGAVILLEMQGAATFDCNGDGAINADYVPAEVVPAVRDAVKVATANGRIVVAAGGNGNCNLDLAGFGGYFSATDATKDSGAIIVGAGEKLTRNKASFSTYGSRVDTQSEGDFKIVTTGYGDKYSAEGENLFYTSTFSGTSGASPIVTSATVALSGAMYLRYGGYYHPKEMRDLLRRDGTPQAAGGKIGPRPDLRKQISHMQNRYPAMHSTDFDGDGRSDYAVWRPSTGVWNIRFSSSGLTQSIQWGQQDDIPVPADVTGDARAELIVWRPSTGTWHVRNWDGTTQSTPWGMLGDIPVPLDFTGDKKAEFVVYRPPYVGGTPEGQWIIRYANGSYSIINWGATGDVPIARDFDGDGYEDVSVYRPSTGQWIIRFFSGSSVVHALGSWSDVPVPYKASNQWNLAVWNPTTGIFTTKNIHGGGTTTAQWGLPGDIPRFGDTNLDGTDEYIVWRPVVGTWYNAQFGGVQWGLPGDIALSR